MILITHDLGVVAGVADRVHDHVRRPRGRDRSAARGLRDRRAPVHPWVDGLDPGALRPAGPVDADPRRPARPDPAARRLRVPAALLLRHRGLRHGPAGTAHRARPGRRRTAPPAITHRRWSPMGSPAEPLLSVRDLHTSFPIRSALLQRKIGAVRAVAGVSFDLTAGRTLGPGRRVRIGQDHPRAHGHRAGTARVRHGAVRRPRPAELSAAELRHTRREIQMVFQDPYASLNPRLTVEQIISEAWRVHPGVVPRDRWPAEVKDLLARVGLDPDHAGPLSAPVLRRPAPAGRHRPGAGARAPAGDLRRGGVGTGRVGAGPGAQPARRPAGRPRADLPVHRARPVGGAAPVRRGRGDVPRQGGGDRHPRDRSSRRRCTRTRRRCSPRSR